MSETGPGPRPDPADRVARSRTPRDELAEATPHGDVYLRRLIRSQLALSFTGLMAFGGLVGSLPLLFLLAPGLQDVTILGVPLPLLVLAVPLFPLIVVIAVLYQRRADALDESFRDLVSDE